MLEEQLKKFGLSEKEAKTYITLLVLGESSAADVAKESGVNRSSAYVVLETLEKKGLVKALNTDSKQTFKAAPPDKLAEIADENLRKQEEIAKTVKNIIPDLKGMHKEQDFRPVVRFFEGKKEVIDSFEDTLELKEKSIRVISSASRLSKLLPTYFPEYVKKRVEKNVRMIGIHPSDLVSKSLLKWCSPDIDDMLLIPQNKFSFSADVAIYDNKVAYTSTKGPGYAIVIECEEMAKLAKEMFDLMREKLLETDGVERVVGEKVECVSPRLSFSKFNMKN